MKLVKPYTGERLPLWREILYGGGNFTASLFGTIIGTWLSFFYIDTLGFNAKAIGIAMIIYSIWNAINDPLMGFISDRTHTKLGRRLPYVLFGAIPFGLCFIFVFSPPTASLTTPTAQILYYTLSLCVYDFFFTTVLLNWEAVVPDMYEKEKDRGRIIGIAQVADVLGGVIASVAVEPVFTKYGWSAMATIFGCIGAIVMLLTVFGIRENPKHAAQPSLPLLQSIRQTFRSRSFLICVCCVFFVETARLLLMAAVPYYAKYIFPDVDMAAMVITSVVFVSALLFTPLVIFVSNRIGTKKTGFTDNIGSGGIFAYADEVTGRFHDAEVICRHIITPCPVHPDTGVKIEGVFPHWQEVRQVITDMCRYASCLEYLGFDVVITPQGFKILEANTHQDLHRYPTYNDDVHAYFMHKVELKKKGCKLA